MTNWLRWGVTVLAGNRWMVVALAAVAGVLVLVGLARAVRTLRASREEADRDPRCGEP